MTYCHPEFGCDCPCGEPDPLREAVEALALSYEIISADPNAAQECMADSMCSEFAGELRQILSASQPKGR